MAITIPEHDLLTAAEEVGLARAIEAGVLAASALAREELPCGADEADLRQVVEAGRVAQDQFQRANLRLVAALAHKWAGRTRLPAEELLQEGCLGLGEAVRRWDYGRGLRFVSFAYRLVEGAILAAAARRCGELDVSAAAARSMLEARRAMRTLEASLGREVQVSEVAQRLGETPPGWPAVCCWPGQVNSAPRWST